MKRTWIKGGIYPKKIGVFNDFTLFKIGFVKDTIGNISTGYGMQIVFCNLYLACWYFIPNKAIIA